MDKIIKINKFDLKNIRFTFTLKFFIYKKYLLLLIF